MEIPFIGGAYKGRSSDVNAQVCINLYPEMDQMGAKNIAALYGTPGLLEFCDLSVTAELRNCHIVNNSAGNFLYLVAGNTLYKITTAGVATAITGNLAGTTGFVFMEDNGTELMIVEPDVEGYIYETIAGGNLTAIADADFPTPHSLTYQDGYFIVSKKDTGEFYISGSYDGTAWDALDYATAEKDPDYLEAAFADHGQLWLFGRDSTEVWYNSGAADFPFERIAGAHIQEGIRAKASIAQLNESVFLLDAKNRVIEISGLSPKIVSTKHLEYLIDGYATKSDAIGFGYTQEGHAFYVLTFPSADKTWVYDMMSGFWHQRRSYPVDADGTEGRHRANCYAFFNDKHIIGDFENGKLYEWKMNTYTDDTQTIRRIRACPHVHKDRKRLFISRFEIDFESGTGLITGQGSDPQAMLDWSDDGGHTWSNEHWADIGRIGEYEARVVWRRLGPPRNRIFRVTISDPIKVVMINAHLEAELGAS